MGTEDQGVDQLVLDFGGLRLVATLRGAAAPAAAASAAPSTSTSSSVPGPAPQEASGAGRRAAAASVRQRIAPGRERPGPFVLLLADRLSARGTSPRSRIRNAYAVGRRLRIGLNEAGGQLVEGYSAGRRFLAFTHESARLRESREEATSFVADSEDYAIYVIDTLTEAEACALGAGLPLLPSRARR